jgi:hypothetical protein
MQTLRASDIALMISIVLWGILIGGIAYSHVVFFPVYLGDLPESSAIVNGRYGLSEVMFWMSLHPLLIISLVLTLALNWKFEARRKLILIPAVAYFIALVVTTFYFVPGLLAFSDSLNSSIPKADWMARGWWWQRMSWIRGAILGLSFIPLLTALTKHPKFQDK